MKSHCFYKDHIIIIIIIIIIIVIIIIYIAQKSKEDK